MLEGSNIAIACVRSPLSGVHPGKVVAVLVANDVVLINTVRTFLEVPQGFSKDTPGVLLSTGSPTVGVRCSSTGNPTLVGL